LEKNHLDPTPALQFILLPIYDLSKETEMKIAKPRRVTRTYTQTLAGTPAEIFPLYCPVKEALWCEGWDPVVVYSESGVVEKGCVFITEDAGTQAAWFVTEYDAAKGCVEMIKHTPEKTFVKLNILLAAVSAGTSQATITYSYTALSAAGEKALAAFTAAQYETAMEAWEKAMNHYLRTGEMLTGLPDF